MTQASMFPRSEKEEIDHYQASRLLDRCSKTRTIILTDEGVVLTVTPSRRKTICETKPEWVYPVTNLQEASEVISRSYELRNS